MSRRKTDAQLTFADAEFMSQGIQLEERLQVISGLLNSRPDLVDLVHEDLVRDLRKRTVGRDGLNASRTLRSLILQRIKNWTLRELAERIADGYSLRLFTGFRMDKVPKHDAFNRAFNRIRAATFEAINSAVIGMAVAMGIEGGSQLRVDSTVVETNIHYPTDASLLVDTVRTINRLAKRVKEKHPEATRGFKRRTKAAKRRLIAFHRARGRQASTDWQADKYGELLRITEETLHMGLRVLQRARTLPVPDCLDVLGSIVLEHLCKEIEHFVDLGWRVIYQTKARVFERRQISAEEKIVSIFEPHTDIIIRGKANRPVEFGHKIFLAETKAGLITQCEVLEGNPSDDSHVAPSLDRHHLTFDRCPDVYAADRGFYSQANMDVLAARGVRIRSIPRRGRTPAGADEQASSERDKAFRLAQRFRSGIEGRISVLLRGRGLRRCLQKGLRNFQHFVAAGALANNLLVVAAAVIKRRAKKRRAAA